MNKDNIRLEQEIAAYECFNCGILLSVGFDECPMCGFKAVPPYTIKPVYSMYDSEE